MFRGLSLEGEPVTLTASTRIRLIMSRKQPRPDHFLFQKIGVQGIFNIMTPLA